MPARVPAENPTSKPPVALPTAAPTRGSVVNTIREGNAMIEARGLSKRYGDKVAVDDLSFTVRPGMVTGFLGPNGAGKSTTMRMILGLDQPSSGSVTVNGRPYREHLAPLQEVGAMLDGRSVHPGRSAYHHLLSLAQTNGIHRGRVDAVIEAVGLPGVARRRAGGFSLGMGQRLGIAAALLGDPHTVILDEPVNGLDTEGIRWIRSLLRDLAVEGRTVFVSSHLMTEMSLTADHVIVIGRGRLIADTTVAQLLAGSSHQRVRVRTTAPDRLAELLNRPDVSVSYDDDALIVSGLSTDQIGTLAGAAGLTLLELSAQQNSLEEAFLELTRDAVEYRVPTTTGATS
jgi:ABC-2 type transport system ATP-binding protein